MYFQRHGKAEAHRYNVAEKGLFTIWHVRIHRRSTDGIEINLWEGCLNIFFYLFLMHV